MMPLPDLSSASNQTNQRDDRQLTRLILNAWQRVPFYSRHWNHLGSRLASMKFPAQLSELPVVRKSDLLAQRAADLLDSSYDKQRLSIEKTSGSSGQPMEIHKDTASTRRRGLRFLRALIGCGYRPGHRVLVISTRRSAGLKRFIGWHYADLRDEDLLREYQTVRPYVLYGPLSSLLQICDLARANGTDLHRPAVLVSTAEQMIPSQRTLLEKSFRCPVADFYGMTEVGLVAFRRPNATRFELASKRLLLEYLPINDATGAERLIVTDITGGARPVIRYDTGDLVFRSTQEQGNVIRDFVGRSVDRITLPSGQSISPYRVTLRLEALPHLRGYQVVQRKDMSLDVYFNTDDQHTDAVRVDICNALAELCGELPARFHFQRDAVHRVAGKFRPVQSELRPSD